jgi:uncharacterized protein
MKRLRNLLLFVLAGYLMILTLMMWMENRLVYHPTPAAVRWTDPPIEMKEVILNETRSTHGWWLPTTNAKFALLICHGNAGNVSDRALTMQRFARWLGVSVLIFDYPGFGKTPGKPNEMSCIETANDALTWLQQHGFEAKDIILYGESLGGGVAMILAESNSFRAVTLVKTFTSLPEVAARKYPWLPVRLLMRNRLNSLSRIPNCQSPLFIAGATNDRLVPFQHSEILFEAAREPKQFFRLEGQDHQDRLPDEYFIELKEFLLRTEPDSN